jgi:hypothetical protein
MGGGNEQSRISNDGSLLSTFSQKELRFKTAQIAV